MMRPPSTIRSAVPPADRCPRRALEEARGLLDQVAAVLGGAAGTPVGRGAGRVPHDGYGTLAAAPTSPTAPAPDEHTDREGSACLAGACEELLVSVSGGPLSRGLVELGRGGSGLEHLRTVPVRVLCAATLDPPVLERWCRTFGHDGRTEVRAATGSVPDMVIIDELRVVVPQSDGFRVVHDPLAVRALRALMLGLWDGALGRAHRPRPVPVLEQPIADVLACLARGDKDELAARRLGMSVRTYRRHVASLLADLDARSRFQAGVAAGRVGIVPTFGTTTPRAPLHPGHRPAATGP